MVSVSKIKPIKYMRTGSKITYCFLDLLLSSLIFVIVYWFWIKDMEFTFQKFGYIFFLGLIAGLVGSLMGRSIANYWVIGKTAQSFLSSAFNSFFYAIFLVFGFLTLLLNGFDLTTTIGIIQFISVLIFIKFFVFFMSDFYADKILFQRS